MCALSFIQKGTVCAMRWGVEMKEGEEERPCEVSLYSPPALRASCPSGPKQEKDRRWNEEGPEEVLTASGIAPCQLYSASLLSGSKFLQPFFFSLLCLLLSRVHPSVFYRVEYQFIFVAFSSCESVVDSPGCNFLCRLFPVLFWRFSVLVDDSWLPPFVLFPAFVNLPCFARVLFISLRTDCTWVVIAPLCFCNFSAALFGPC